MDAMVHTYLHYVHVRWEVRKLASLVKKVKKRSLLENMVSLEMNLTGIPYGAVNLYSLMCIEKRQFVIFSRSAVMAMNAVFITDLSQKKTLC